MSLGFGKIVVFGVGLIGGSFALALKRTGMAGEVVGIGRSRATLDEALRRGLIDRVGACDAATLKNADIVLLATPVGQMPPLMQAMAPHLGSRVVITDGGSTKSDVVAAVRRFLPQHLARFVPAHPIAGAANSGAAAATADHYVYRKVVLTPLPDNDAAAVARLRPEDADVATLPICAAGVLLDPDEHVRVAVTGQMLGHPAVVVLTDRRVLVVNGRRWQPMVDTFGLGASLVVRGRHDRHVALLTFSEGSRLSTVDAITDVGLAVELTECIRTG